MVQVDIASYFKRRFLSNFYDGILNFFHKNPSRENLTITFID